MKYARLPYAKRAVLCVNATAKKLFSLIANKKTNLALSADVDNAAALLELAEKLGPEICVLKTHIDIISDFSPALIHDLTALAKQHEFLIFEDRKFADIANTVKQQYAGGMYRIADWADIVNAHSLPGEGVIEGLAAIGVKKHRALLLLAQMSSAKNLLDAAYTAKTLALAEQFPEFVIGFIAQEKLSADPRFIYLTPGVQLTTGKDDMGQQYVTPRQAIEEHGSDVIIVGRGILTTENPLAAAKTYRAVSWSAYETALSVTQP